jgi:predicted phage tail protein
MRTIRLYGPLAEKVGQDSFRAEISTVAESVRFLLANFPHLEPFMAGYNYSVYAGTHNVGEDEIHNPVGSDEDVHLIPIISGSGAVGRMITGVVLVVASFFIPGVALFGVALGPVLFGIGASLVLGGVSQLLSPVAGPKNQVLAQRREKNPQEIESYSISGVQNTSRQGVPVNVVYGEIVTGAIIISAGITTADR